MNFSTLLKTALQSIRLNWLRTLLTLLGIVIGVAAVIVMTAVGEGSQRDVLERIAKLGDNLLLVSAAPRNFGGVNFGAGSSGTLTIGDFLQLQKAVPAVAGMTPVIRASGQLVGGSGNYQSNVQGVNAAFLTVRNWQIEQGSFFSDLELQRRALVAVIGATVQAQLFADSDPIGQTLRIGTIPFTIIGTLQARGSSFMGDQDDVVLVPYTTLQARMSGGETINQIIVAAQDDASMKSLEAEITDVLRAVHHLRDTDENDFRIRNQADLISVVSETARTMTMLLGSVAAISLFVGGIGIMNMMLVAVTERTKEIGLRLAVGARARDIMHQFLLESVLICMVGGLLGVALGVLIAMGLQQFFAVATALTAAAIVLAVCFAVFVGIVFGLYPARRAARLDPIEALRYGSAD